jgi:hypothetical protein
LLEVVQAVHKDMELAEAEQADIELLFQVVQK